MCSTFSFSRIVVFLSWSKLVSPKSDLGITVTSNMEEMHVHACLEPVEGHPLNILSLREAGNLFRGHQIAHMKLNQKCRTASSYDDICI